MWFTLPPQQFLLVSWLFSVIPIPGSKILFFNHSSLCAFFLIHSWIRLHNQAPQSTIYTTFVWEFKVLLSVYYTYFPDWQRLPDIAQAISEYCVCSIWQFWSGRLIVPVIWVISSQWKSFHPGKCMYVCAPNITVIIIIVILKIVIAIIFFVEKKPIIMK